MMEPSSIEIDRESQEALQGLYRQREIIELQIQTILKTIQRVHGAEGSYEVASDFSKMTRAE